MRICQVHPGCGIPVPPPNWGAVEKIVWEFTQNLRKLGHTVDIKYANEIKPGDYDVVHVHMANLAIFLHERGVKYIYQLHDHHAYYYGKDSRVFKQNLLAIENSEVSLMPGRFLVPYFNTPKAVYFSHGVNTDFFKPSETPKEHRLLCLANNGMAGMDGYDRKGFGFAIKAAMAKNLPITIAGPRNNENFLKENPWVYGYPKLNLEWEPNQDELLDLYQRHTIFMHPSELEAGHPNLTILEAAACGLPINGWIEMETDFSGMWRANRDVLALVNGLDDIINDYDNYRQKAINHAESLSWYNRSIELLKVYQKPSSI
jgi:glycosyltransferase involved in cell wall biosynthesis